MKNFKQYLQMLQKESLMCKLFGHSIKWYIVSKFAQPCTRCGEKVHWSDNNVTQQFNK